MDKPDFQVEDDHRPGDDFGWNLVLLGLDLGNIIPFLGRDRPGLPGDLSSRTDHAQRKPNLVLVGGGHMAGDELFLFLSQYLELLILGDNYHENLSYQSFG